MLWHKYTAEANVTFEGAIAARSVFVEVCAQLNDRNSQLRLHGGRITSGVCCVCMMLLKGCLPLCANVVLCC
jgi:hypothetical protein